MDTTPTPDLPTSFAGLTSYQLWIAIAALVIGVLVRLLKSAPESWPFTLIRPAARPVVALVLGQLSGVLAAAAIPGVDAKAAILAGLISGAAAIAGHQVFIEWLRGGLELFAKPAVPDATEALAAPVRLNPLAPAPALPDPPRTAHPGNYSEVFPADEQPTRPDRESLPATPQPTYTEKDPTR